MTLDRIVIRVVSIILFGVHGWTAAMACPCVLPRTNPNSADFPTVDEAFARADAVFLGLVREIQPVTWESVPILPGKDEVEAAVIAWDVALEVSTVWKGTRPGAQVNVRTSAFDCGVRFEMGEEFLVYAEKRQFPDGTFMLSTDICHRTARAATATTDRERLDALAPEWDVDEVLRELDHRDPAESSFRNQ